MSSSTSTSGFLKKISLNKYLFVLTVFAVYVIFFDEYNLISRLQTGRNVAQLEREIIFYQEEIKSNKEKMQELQSNNENLEKYAREQFLMKKENEDIFIIKE